MKQEITEAQKEFEREWNQNPDVQEFLYQNDIEDESMYFAAAWFMWKQAKGVE